MDQSYFPSDQWTPVGDHWYLTTGTIAYHNVDGRGTISTCPAVFLRDALGFSPVYRGSKPAETLQKMLAWLGNDPIPAGCNLFVRLKSVQWDVIDIT